MNIGNYYLFQPSELFDKNISIYDRKVPIEFKHDKIYLKVPEKIKEDIPVEKEIVLEEELEIEKGKIILDRMFNLYNISNTKQLIVRGDDNWYKFCNIIMNQMQEEGVEKALLEEFLVSHIIEELLFNDLFDIINYIYNSNKTLTDFEKVKNYFESKELKNKGITGILYIKKANNN